MVIPQFRNSAALLHMAKPESIVFDAWMVPGKSGDYTHVSLRGGTFRAHAHSARDERAAFTKAYLRVLETGAYTPAMSEVVDLNAFPVLVDLDLAFFLGPDAAYGGAHEPELEPELEPEPEHAVTESFLREAVEAYRDAIASMCEPASAARTRASEAIVMQRASPYASKTTDGVVWKDGVHVFFPDVRMSPSEQAVVHARVLAAQRLQAALVALMGITEGTALSTAGQVKWTKRDVRDGIVDATAYTKPNASWQMYGSSKPEVAAPYLATFVMRGEAWERVKNPRDWSHWVARTRVFGFHTKNEYSLSPTLTAEAIAEADAEDVRIFNTVAARKNSAITDGTPGGPPGDQCFEPADKRDRAVIRLCLSKLATWRAEKYSTWRDVGCALAWASRGSDNTDCASNTAQDTMWNDWLEFSRRCDSKFSVRNCQDEWRKRNAYLGGGGTAVRTGSLVKWAKEDIATGGGDAAEWWMSVLAEWPTTHSKHSKHSRQPCTSIGPGPGRAGMPLTEAGPASSTFTLTEVYRLDRVWAALPESGAADDIVQTVRPVPETEVPAALAGTPLGKRSVKYYVSTSLGRSRGRAFAAVPGAYQRLAPEVVSRLGEDLYVRVSAATAGAAIIARAGANASPKPVVTPRIREYEAGPSIVVRAVARELRVPCLGFASRAIAETLSGMPPPLESAWLVAAADEVSKVAAAEFPGLSAPDDAKAGKIAEARAVQIAALSARVASEEFRAADAAVACLQDHGFDVGAVLAGGVSLLVRAPVKDASSVATSCAAEVALRTGMTLRFAVKELQPMPSGDDGGDVELWTPEHAPRDARDDTDAGEIVLDELRWCMRRCGETFLVLDRNRVWTSYSRAEAVTAVADLVPHVRMRFPQMDPRLRESYHRNARGARAIADRALAGLPNELGLPARMSRSTQGRLFYRRGYWEFASQQFCALEGAEAMTQVRIPFDFPERPSAAAAEEFDRRVMRTVFPVEAERTAFLQGVVRSMAGCVGDKVFFMFVGTRNTGKSALCSLLMNTFPGYVGTFNASSLVKRSVKPGSSGSGGAPVDEDRALAFINQFEVTRLMFTNEIRCDKNSQLDGELIKMISSGRDKIRTRKLFRESIEIRPQATMFISANNPPDVDPSDATQFQVKFTGRTKFVPCVTDALRAQMAAGDRTNYVQGDDSIDDYLASPEAVAAMTWRLLDEWMDSKPQYPACVLDPLEDRVEPEDVLMEMVVRGSAADFIPSAHLQTAMCARGEDLGSEKLGSILKVKLNAVNSKRRVNGQQMRGFLGVRWHESVDVSGFAIGE